MPAAFQDKRAVTRALRLALRSLPPHSHQLIPKEDDLSVDCDDNYRPQPPSVKMNFIPKATEIPAPWRGFHVLIAAEVIITPARDP